MNPHSDPQLIRIIQQMDPQWTGGKPTFHPPLTGLPKDWASRLDAESATRGGLSPEDLAVLFRVPIETIQGHLNALSAEGAIPRVIPDEINVEAIFAVGFRVDSSSGIQFRKWATATLSDFAIKGYLVDHDRLAQEGPWSPDYFEYLMEELDLIRKSSRTFHQRLTDLYETALDYHKDDPTSRTLWDKVAAFPLDGTAPKGSMVELPVLDWIIDLYLDFAEHRASRHLPMAMTDWAARFEAVLGVTEQELLERPDDVASRVAKALAVETQGVATQNSEM